MHEPAHSQPLSPFAPQTRLSTLLAALLAALVLLPLLGHRPLTDWDEGIYAEIAREMLATHTLGAFLIPHWNGHLWFEKPPLQMWLTAASLRLFGLNAFAARLPSALAGIATVAALHRWLERRLPRHEAHLTAWLSTVILLSAFGFQHVSRVGETDTLLSLFCLLAVLGLADLLQNNAGGWLLFFLGLALALMTKGAASLTLPLTALALIAIHPGKLLRHPRTFTVGLLLFLAITLPWHAYVYAHFGAAFLHDYLGFHTLTRATGAIEGHRTQPWFYLWVLLVSAPLCSLLYPSAIAAPFRRKHAAHSADPLQAFAVFALITIALFTTARTRLPHYIAPAYPELSALAASLLARWLQSRPEQLRRTAIRLAPAAILLYAAAAFLTAKPRKALHNPQLRNGYTTPDNRESAALLQNHQNTAAPLPPGRLLVWRQTAVVPLTTDAFYAGRLAQQVSLASPPRDLPLDPYFNDPQPLANFLDSPHLVLVDRSLIPQLPPGAALLPLATGPTQELAILAPTLPPR